MNNKINFVDFIDKLNADKEEEITKDIAQSYLCNFNKEQCDITYKKLKHHIEFCEFQLYEANNFIKYFYNHKTHAQNFLDREPDYYKDVELCMINDLNKWKKIQEKLFHKHEHIFMLLVETTNRINQFTENDTANIKNKLVDDNQVNINSVKRRIQPYRKVKEITKKPKYN